MHIKRLLLYILDLESICSQYTVEVGQYFLKMILQYFKEFCDNDIYDDTEKKILKCIFHHSFQMSSFMTH